MYVFVSKPLLRNISSDSIDTICAIGAYYTSLTGKTELADTLLHEKYFSCALNIAPMDNIKRSLSQVSLLLVRCFYLLVVCRTERYVLDPQSVGREASMYSIIIAAGRF